MAARTSSGAQAAPVDSLSAADGFLTWRGVDWTPWLIVALGAFLRVFLLGIKPPHFDEGINGWFVDQMTKTGFYKYDPTNYHGPFHFYILFLSQTLFGRNLWALRMPVVLGSIGCIWQTLKFAPFVGRNVSRIAALAMAVSPGFVFYGRYSIHEVWLLLFSMLFIRGLLGLWQFGTRSYLAWAAVGCFGMILTKETYIIHIGCVLLALPIAWLTHRLLPASRIKFAQQQWTWLDLATAIILGLAALIFFYSGTFMNMSGVKGLITTFATWKETGSNGNGHGKDWYYWLQLIGRYELPIAIGLLASLLCLFYQEMATRFLCIYGVGVLMAYSIVNYKTPWCLISIVWPLLFPFGAALMLLARYYRSLSYGLTAIVLAISLFCSVRLNYFRCTTDTEPYVYVQTYNDMFKLTEPLLKLARRNPLAYQLVGHLVRTSAYPLPWVLGDFGRIGYYEKDNMPPQLDADFLLVQEDRIAEIEGKLHNAYYTSPLTLRPYQDTSKLYLSAKVFKDFFHGRAPDFAGSNNGHAE